MQQSHAGWGQPSVKEKEKKRKKRKRQKKKGGRKPKKKVPEVVCKNFPFMAEGHALALGDLGDSCQLH